jgi:hypothetical protein
MSRQMARLAALYRTTQGASVASMPPRMTMPRHLGRAERSSYPQLV